MSGLEAAAAIFTIIGGIVTAYKLAAELRQHYHHHRKAKQRRSGIAKPNSSIEHRLQRIEQQLQRSEAQLAGLRVMAAAGGRGAVALGAGGEITTAALQQVLAVLQRIAADGDGDAGGAGGSAAEREMECLERYTGQWEREAGLLARGICPNAVRYRREKGCGFEEVAVRRRRRQGSASEWACRLCGVGVGAAEMPLSRAFGREGQVYVTPNGAFKAHTTGGAMWACIWEEKKEKKKKGEERGCEGVFEGRRALLQHMQSTHMRNDLAGNRLVVDGAADLRESSVAKCGYGVLHADKPLEVDGDGLVLRYGES